MMRHLSTLLAWCGLLLSSASISSAAQPQLDGTSRSPNIVLLISDDDDYEHFGFMGSKIAQTPTLDELVANGTLFTTAHCPAPLCRPSLASMLSGKLPNQHGIYGNYIDRRGIGKDTIKLDPTGSLANRLKDAGYATYASGKFWEGDPREMGFTHGTVEVTMKGFRQFVREGQDELFQFIDDQRQKKPMFIWWAPLLPHGPYNPPPKYFDRFADTKIPIPSFYQGDRKEYVATMRKFYAMGTWFDDGVAQLIEKLKAAGEYENTLFLFYTDNGVTFGMPGKNSPTEKGLRTSVFVTWPDGGVPVGKRIDTLNYALDLHATALDYAGIKAPSDIASKSLRPQIEGKTKQSHDALFGAVYAHHPHKYSGDPSIARSAGRDAYALYARSERWKYVLYTQDLTAENARYIAMGLGLTGPFIRDQGEQELFDLHADPYERNNLATQADQQERVAEFRSKALNWWVEAGGGPLKVAAHNRVAQSDPESKTEPRIAEGFFNGKNLNGWEVENDVGVWTVKDGAIDATSGDEDMPNYQFLWNKTTVKNFHLSLMVKQTPYEANGGIQFRSARLEKGLALGYQADVGKDWWGVLYHEHGRRVLGRRADAEGKDIKREGWNHYEVLAVGQRVWLAINGKVSVALRDKFGESEGLIALQAHSGIPQTVAYKELKLIHDPKVELAGLDEAALNALLVDAPEMGVSPGEYLNPGAAKAGDAKKAPRKGGAPSPIQQLGLDAEQKKKLAEFTRANRDKLAAALKLKGDEKKTAMGKIIQARNAKFEEIFTEEQATRFKELQEKARENNKKKVKNPQAAISQEKPNVILIMADDMGYADIQRFGKSGIPTPALNRLADEGVKFTDAYVTAPICVASRMGLMRGRHQQRFGVYCNFYKNNQLELFRKATLLPVPFQQAGYRTGMVGKWHLAGNSQAGWQHPGPLTRGFDECVAITGGGSPFWAGANIVRQETYQESPAYLTDLWGTEAAAFVEQNARNPFFLCLAFNAVHAPMHALDEDIAPFEKSIEDPNRRIYAGMLRSMDRAIGGVLDQLDKHGIADNTLVIFLNDNGGGGNTDQYASHSRNWAENQPFRGHKFDVFEGGVRVPMMIRWPARLKAGSVFQLVAGENSLDIEIEEPWVSAPHPAAEQGAKEPGWYLSREWKEWEAGTLALEKGKPLLQLRVKSKPGKEMADIKSVMLRKI